MSSTPNSVSRGQPLDCLVIQLAKLGDLLQSLMALRAAKQLYPELEFTLVVREKFAEAARSVPWIKDVIVLPTDAWLSPILEGQSPAEEALSELNRILGPALAKTWDFSINWTFSDASSYLNCLIPARVKLGYSRRKDGTFYCSDGWSHYIQGVVQASIQQNIHLTDILTTQLLTAMQIHLGDPSETAQNAGFSPKGFFQFKTEGRNPETHLGRNHKWVALQLSSGSAGKDWAAEDWAELACYVLSRHPDWGVVLLGAPGDAAAAQVVLGYVKDLVPEGMDRIIDFVGQTDFADWTTLMGRCHWIVTTETAGVHLASVLGTRILHLCASPWRFLENGPYGNGHYVLCTSKDMLSPEAAYAAWSYGTSEWSHRRQIPIAEHFSRTGAGDDFPNVRLLRSRIRGTQDGGGVAYEALNRTPLTINDWFGQVIGHVARAWYCGWTPEIGKEIDRDALHPALIAALRQLDESSEVLVKICEEAKRTAIELHSRGKRLKSDKIMDLREKQELKNLAKKLHDLDLLIDRLVETQPALTVFAQMSKVLMHNLRGEALSDLGLETAESYGQLSYGVSLLREWSKFTLNLVKPKAIGTGQVIPLHR